MEMINKIEWVKCPQCGHKLFKVIELQGGDIKLEHKCHSCKTICRIQVSDAQVTVSRATD